MNSRTIKIVLAACVLLVAAVFTVYTLWNKPHRAVAGVKAKEVKATELYRIFNSDTALATQQYLQQVLAVEGLVQRITENQQKQTVVTLETGTEGASINCTFEGPASGIAPGKTVTIKGICGGLAPADPDLGIPGDLYLLRCYTEN